MARTPLPVPRSRALRTERRFSTCSIVSRPAGGGAVMSGPEGLSRVDLDGEIAQAYLVAVMRTMDEEPTGPNRLQFFKRMAQPIDIRQVFDAHSEDRGESAPDRRTWPAKQQPSASTARKGMPPGCPGLRQSQPSKSGNRPHRLALKQISQPFSRRRRHPRRRIWCRGIFRPRQAGKTEAICSIT